MVELSARGGFHEVSIAELCAGAGVSSVTFYEQFADKEDVLVSAYRACAEFVFGQMRAAVAEGEIARVPHVALGALLRAVASDPDAGRILFIEALSGGERMREERTRAFGRFERRVQEYLEHAPRESSALDVPVIAVVGALRHIVARHLRNRAEDELPSRLEDGLRWLYSYARAPGAQPWSTSPAALARVAKPVFYQHFRDKEHAFLEAQQYPTQFILDRCAEAYFSADEWPERIWRMLQALINLIIQNPAISHLRLVECYSAGPEAIRRAEEITRSFTIFLEEGYRHSEKGHPLPKLASQAITGAIFEIVQRHLAQRDPAALSAHLPQLAYIAIAPFTGAQEAIRLVEDMKARPALSAGK
jgi:AcrR family transcriptional regulator